MPRNLSLRGVGLPYMLSRLLGNYGDEGNITCGGGSLGSATKIPPPNKTVYVNASNSGSGLALPQPGDFSTSGCDLGDRYTITNLLGASVVVYAPGGMNFAGAGASTAGTVGISVAANTTKEFIAISATTWTTI